jgi:hypothetical protein
MLPQNEDFGGKARILVGLRAEFKKKPVEYFFL